METVVVHKKSNTASEVPLAADIDIAELAINLVDKKIYTKDHTDTVIDLTTAYADTAYVKVDGTSTMTGFLSTTGIIVSDANGIQWGSGRNRITNNDGGGNCQIKFGHYFNVSDKFTADGSSAGYIGQAIDSENQGILIKVNDTTSGVINGDTVTWGTNFFVKKNSLVFGSTTINDDGTATLQASDSVKLGGVVEAEAATVSTIVKRNSFGDINTRLFRSEYVTTESAPLTTSDLCFRVNNSTDNYMRFMSASAFTTWCINAGVTFTSGSNANGKYIKYGDGTMICWSPVLSTTAGNSATWTFPVAFIDTTTVVTGNFRYSALAANFIITITPTTTSVEFGASNTSGTLVESEQALVAIGKWQ